MSGQSMRNKRGPSVIDVAKLANVSKQTVSRVANASPKVAEDTRQRVLEAMEELGYSPNSAARGLRMGHYASIGLIGHRFSRTGESFTIDAVVEAARDLNYGVSLVDLESTAGSDMTEAVHHLSSQSVDGLVIIHAEGVTPGALLLPPRLPVVVSDSRFAGHHPSVISDQPAGVEMAIDHLLALGHRNIAHVAGPEDSLPATVRVDAWHEQLSQAGCVPGLLWRGDWSFKSGYALAPHVAKSDSTAVFCANDEMAIGLIAGLREEGVEVPRDMSIVGFDGLPVTEFLAVPLTTVAQDFESIGKTLVNLLDRQIKEDKLLSGVRTTIPVRFIERASTAPVTI